MENPKAGMRKGQLGTVVSQGNLGQGRLTGLEWQGAG